MTKERLEQFQGRSLFEYAQFSREEVIEALNEIEACWKERDAVREALKTTSTYGELWRKTRRAIAEDGGV